MESPGSADVVVEGAEGSVRSRLMRAMLYDWTCVDRATLSMIVIEVEKDYGTLGGLALCHE